MLIGLTRPKLSGEERAIVKKRRVFYFDTRNLPKEYDLDREVNKFLSEKKNYFW